MTDDEFEPFAVLFGFLGFVITMVVEIIVFAIELSIDALVMILTLMWGLVCMILDITQND